MASSATMVMAMVIVAVRPSDDVLSAKTEPVENA
jgi:hypothetical protein